jgi:hypothetical protein
VDGRVDIGSNIETGTVGEKPFSVEVAYAATVTCDYSVVYELESFFGHMTTPLAFNTVRAGSTAPITFGLDGNWVPKSSPRATRGPSSLVCQPG